jgi:hypothetical protein
MRDSQLLSHIAYWIEKNRAAGVNEINGRYWTYLSVNKIHDKFLYYSTAKIRRSLASLERRGLILKDHFKLKNNTCFYALPDNSAALFTNRTFHADGGLEPPKERIVRLKKNGGAPKEEGGGVMGLFDGAGAERAAPEPERFGLFDGSFEAADKPAYVKPVYVEPEMFGSFDDAPEAANGRGRADPPRRKPAAEIASRLAAADEWARRRRRTEPKPDALGGVLLAVGVGCLIMSMRNSWLYLTGAGFTPAAAFATALITACFTASAFSIKSAPVKALACLVVGFSIFSTFSVYYSHYDKEAARTARLGSAGAEREARLEEARRARDAAGERAAALAGEAEYWRDKSWARYDAAQAGIAELYSQERALTEFILSPAAPVAEAGAEAGAVFAAFEPMAAFLGVTAEFLRLIIFIIPAVFFDLASPLLFANYFKGRPDEAGGWGGAERPPAFAGTGPRSAVRRRAGAGGWGGAA